MDWSCRSNEGRVFNAQNTSGKHIQRKKERKIKKQMANKLEAEGTELDEMAGSCYEWQD